MGILWKFLLFMRCFLRIGPILWNIKFLWEVPPLLFLSGVGQTFRWCDTCGTDSLHFFGQGNSIETLRWTLSNFIAICSMDNDARRIANSDSESMDSIWTFILHSVRFPMSSVRHLSVRPYERWPHLQPGVIFWLGAARFENACQVLDDVQHDSLKSHSIWVMTPRQILKYHKWPIFRS